MFNKNLYFKEVKVKQWIINNSIAEQLVVKDTIFNGYNVLMVFGV
jgi:hypothetical protein